MITGILVIFKKLYCHYEQKWNQEIEKRKYETWEQYEATREEFGVKGSNLERMPRRKKCKKNQVSRQKHRY